MNQQEYFGFGSIHNLRNILEKEKAKKIFLVTGKSSYELCGAKSACQSLLSQYQITRFYDFSPNPKLEDIEKGLELFRQNNCDLLIAIGGGSVIDMAKAIKMFFYDKNERKISLVAIPTTAGSGSEATYFIVYYKEKEKQSEGKPELTLPDYSIIDPNFMLFLPKNITASTGMDALSQAIESYWCINSNEESKKYAREAILLIISNLFNAVNNPSKNSRFAMAKAANLSGKAINITKTTACHAISYYLTSHFNIPHGHAVALTLPSILVYNSKVTGKDCTDKRGAEYVRETIKELVRLLGAGDEEDAKNKLINLMENIGLETRLSKLGISNIEHMPEDINKERLKNNPRELSRKNLRQILENIF